MRIVPVGFINQSQLTKVIDKAIGKLGKDAVRVRYSFGEDSTGEPSLYFRIVLTDAASRPENLAKATGRIQTILNDEVLPRDNWGLIPYYSFRSKSEQAGRNDPEWG